MCKTHQSIHLKQFCYCWALLQDPARRSLGGPSFETTMRVTLLKHIHVLQNLFGSQVFDMVLGSAPTVYCACRTTCNPQQQLASTTINKHHYPTATTATTTAEKKSLRAAVAFRSWRVRRLFWCLFVFFVVWLAVWLADLRRQRLSLYLECRRPLLRVLGGRGGSHVGRCRRPDGRQTGRRL